MKKLAAAVMAAFLMCAAHGQTCVPNSQTACTPNLGLYQPVQGVTNWANYVNRNFSTLDSTIAALQSLFQGSWSSSVTYQKGQVVTYGGLNYQSTVNVNVGNTPSGSSAQWIPFSVNGSMVYPPMGVPCSTGSAWCTSYQVGTSANDLVQLITGGALPAVSGANLTNLPVMSITATSPVTASNASGVWTLACPTCGTGTGTSVQVNGGSALGTANLNGTTPAAGTDGINVAWQNSGNNVSAEIVGDGNSAHFLNGLGQFAAPSSCTGSTANGVCYNDGGTATYSSDVLIDAANVNSTANVPFQTSVPYGHGNYAFAATYGPQPSGRITNANPPAFQSSAILYGDADWDEHTGDGGAFSILANAFDAPFSVTNFYNCCGTMAVFTEYGLQSTYDACTNISLGVSNAGEYATWLYCFNQVGAGNRNFTALGMSDVNFSNSVDIDSTGAVYFPTVLGTLPWSSPTPSPSALCLDGIYGSLTNSGCTAAPNLSTLSTQTGASYTTQASDCTALGTTIRFTNAGNVALTLASGSSTAGCRIYLKSQMGTGFSLTITPSSGTIDGGSSATIYNPGDAQVQFDGTNWTYLAGAGVRGASNLTADYGIPYVNNPGSVTELSGNTAATDQVVTSTGTGSAAQAPTLKNAPALSGANLTALPTNTALYPTLNQSTTGNAATATKAPITAQLFNGTALSPSANSTYYIGVSGSALGTAANAPIWFAPRAGTLAYVGMCVGVAGTLDTGANNMTLHIYDVTTSTAFSDTSMTFNAESHASCGTATPSDAISAGDKLAMQITTPTSWTTPPTSVSWNANLLIN